MPLTMNRQDGSPADHAGNVAFFIPHEGCPHTCSYCNQRHISGQSEPPAPEDVSRLLQDIVAARPEKARSMQIAFFGGSFTAIDPRYRRALLEAAACFCGENGFAGIRISTRPDAITPGILGELARFHVTDIELGVQSMDDAVLERNYRGHTARDVEDATSLIRECSEARVVHQMMTGLPGDTDEGALHTAWRIAELRPDAVRVYPAIVLHNTIMADWFFTGAYIPPALDEAVALGAKLLTFFTRQEIPVIRMGLQENEGVKQAYVAGPYHPAFRELCEGNALFDRIVPLAEAFSPGPLYIRVHPRNISALTGHGRRAFRPLEEAGYSPIALPDAALGYLEVQVSG